MRRFALAVTALTLAVCVVSFVRAADADAKKMASKDTKFIRGAASGGLMEVELGKLAADKGSDADVKKFGQTMVDDHTKANDELKTLASTKGVDLTKPLENATKKAEKEKETLSKKEGAAFDKAYIELMVKDHEKDVKEFKEASESSEDADLKAWAGKTLPTLESHLKMAKETKEKLGK